MAVCWDVIPCLLILVIYKLLVLKWNGCFFWNQFTLIRSIIWLTSEMVCNTQNLLELLCWKFVEKIKLFFFSKHVEVSTYSNGHMSYRDALKRSTIFLSVNSLRLVHAQMDTFPTVMHFKGAQFWQYFELYIRLHLWLYNNYINSCKGILRIVGP